MTNQKPTWQEELSEFKEKSANFINGRLSPLAFDKWFVEKLSQAEARGYDKAVEQVLIMEKMYYECFDYGEDVL